jgi:hypothetical protein
MLKTKANHSTERKTTFFSLNSNLLIEDVTKGLYFIIMSCNALSVQYQKPFEDILVSIERLFLHCLYSDSEVCQSVDQVVKNLF